MRELLTKQLMRHEGYRRYPYQDSVGKLTVGYGRNLDDVGITEREAEMLLQRDINKAWRELRLARPVVNVLSDTRQDVLINMTVNMGLGGVHGFRKMWAALNAGDFVTASAEMLDSKWATQVGDRAEELARQMEKG